MINFDKNNLMSTAELKLDLIQKITDLKEIRVIEELQNLLDFETDRGIFQINTAQRNRILEAKNDDVLSEEEANLEIEEWLKEK